MVKDHLPWFAFYPKDWLADPELRGCSPAARGLWADLLCLMDGMEQRGVLATNGTPWTADRVALSVTGFATDLLDVCLRELEANGVLSHTEQGAICSRRMVRDEDIRRKRAIAGQKGGLSKASKQGSKSLAPSNSNSISISKGGTGGNSQRDFWEDAVRAMEGDCLNTVDFQAAWMDWIDERRKTGRKAYTNRGLTGQIHKLEKLGHDRAIAAIRHSITEGYAGIFEPNRASERQTTRKAPAGRTTEDRGEYPESGRPLPGLS